MPNVPVCEIVYAYLSSHIEEYGGLVCRGDNGEYCQCLLDKKDILKCEGINYLCTPAYLNDKGELQEWKPIVSKECYQEK